MAERCSNFIVICCGGSIIFFGMASYDGFMKVYDMDKSQVKCNRS